MRRKFFRNINTGVELTEKEYDELLQREGEELWSNLDEDEKAEWSSKESFIEKCSMEDTDFVEVIKDEEYSIICDGGNLLGLEVNLPLGEDVVLIDSLRCKEYHIICDENDLVATLRESFVEYNLGGEVTNRESVDYILNDYEIDLDEFVKRYDEETGKFMYFEKEITKKEFNELKSN